MNKKIIFSSIGIVIIGIGYFLLSPLWRTVKLDEALPQAIQSPIVSDTIKSVDNAPSNAPVVLKEAILMPSDHEVSGKALLVQVGEEKIIRFENLKTINGPDLRIYLSTGLGDDDVVDLGAIRATEGNVNYTVPPGTDTTKYNNVLIWCRAFGVLFSYAQL